MGEGEGGLSGRQREMEGTPDQHRQTALGGGMRCHGDQILKGSFLRKTIIRPGRRGRALHRTQAHTHTHTETHSHRNLRTQMGHLIRGPSDDVLGDKRRRSRGVLFTCFTLGKAIYYFV